MLEVMYYRGKKNTPELHEKYADRLERLAIDRFHTDCDVKQLKEHQYRGCPIYRAKLNQKARVLFVYLPIDNGTEKLFLLEFLENHEYEQSEFLNGKKLADAEKIGVVELLPSKEKIETEQQADSKPLLKFAQVHFYGNKKLELHKIQLEAFEQSLKQQRSAALVLGQSGSGKTVLAMALLLKGIREHGHTRVLYLTQEEDLCNTVRQKWANHPDYERYKENIECLQFIDFFKKQNKKFQWTPETSQAELEKWLEQHQHRKKFKLESYKFLTIYEEFRTISGYSKEEYCAVDFGKKRCLIQDRETREIFFKAYENWQQYLQTNKIILCDFSEIPEQEKYDVIAIDEIHDFSNLQILQLPKLTERLLCFGDSRQQLADNVRKTIFIQQCLAKHYKDIYEIELPMSHRCPNSIMQFSGAFETMRRQVMSISAKTDKPLLGLEKQGEVEWKTPDSPEADILLKQLANNADACIITLAGSLDKVRKKYPFFTQIFTPDRIKGLEYKHVVLVNFLEDERFRELNKCLKSKGFTDLDALLSACFVAATRPTESLTFLNEKENAQIDEVLRILHAAMAIAQDRSMPGESVCSSSSTSLVVPATVKESTPEEWEQQAKELIQKSLDNTLMVERILVEHLKMNAQEIDAWIAKNRRSIVAERSSSVINVIQPVQEKQQGKNKSKKKPSSPPKELSPDEILAIDDLEEFQRQLTLMSDINKPFDKGHTLLHYACTKGIAGEKLQLLLNQPGINVNAKDRSGCTSLLNAVCARKLAAVNCLLTTKGIDVQSQDDEGRSPLLVAMLEGDKDIAALLLKYPDCINDSVMPIIKKEISWLSISIVQKKINWKYCDPSDGSTPLMWVCKKIGKKDGNFIDYVLSWIDNDIVKIKDNQGCTALFYACLTLNSRAIHGFLLRDDYQENFSRIFEGIPWKRRNFLLKNLENAKNSSTTRLNINRLNEIMEAQQREMKQVLDYLISLQDLEVFEEDVKTYFAGDINQEVFANDNTLLSYVFYKNVAVKKIQILLKMPGINVNVQSKIDNSTLLMWACKIGSKAATEVIDKTELAITLMQKVSLKIDINLRDNQGRTALFYAIESLSTEIVRFFLNHHPDNFQFSFQGLNLADSEALLQNLKKMSIFLRDDPAKHILDGILAEQQGKLQSQLFTPMLNTIQTRVGTVSPREAEEFALNPENTLTFIGS